MIILTFSLLSLAATTGAGAIEMTSLYSAEVPLNQDRNDPRAAAYEAALAEVLLRVSGSAIGDDPELFRMLFPNPTSYVVQFRPGPDDTLWVSFDGDAIEDVLRRNVR